MVETNTDTGASSAPSAASTITEKNHSTCGDAEVLSEVLEASPGGAKGHWTDRKGEQDAAFERAVHELGNAMSEAKASTEWAKIVRDARMLDRTTVAGQGTVGRAPMESPLTAGLARLSDLAMAVARPRHQIMHRRVRWNLVRDPATLAPISAPLGDACDGIVRRRYLLLDERETILVRMEKTRTAIYNPEAALVAELEIDTPVSENGGWMLSRDEFRGAFALSLATVYQLQRKHAPGISNGSGPIVVSLSEFLPWYLTMFSANKLRGVLGEHDGTLRLVTLGSRAAA